MTEVKNKLIKLFIILFFFIQYLNSQAMAGSKSVNVTVEGNILADACTINNNQALNLEFGVVRIDKISTTFVNVPITIKCEDNPTGAVLLEIKGTSSSFDPNVLASNKQGLGVKLIFESSTGQNAVKLNEFSDVKKNFGLGSYTGTFNLHANLVTDGKSELTGGDFTSSATLIVQVN